VVPVLIMVHLWPTHDGVVNAYSIRACNYWFFPLHGKGFKQTKQLKVD